MKRRKRNNLDPIAIKAIALAWARFVSNWLDAKWWSNLVRFIDDRRLSDAIESVPEPTQINAELFLELSDAIYSAMADSYERVANKEYARVGSTVRAQIIKAKKPKKEWDLENDKRGKSRKKNRFTEVPHSDKFIRAQVARLVVEVSREQKATLRDSIMRRYQPNVKAESLVRDIKATVGLNSRLSNAVLNRKLVLQQAKVPPKAIEREVKAYATKLLTYRSEMIARTETAFVAADAKTKAWEVAKDTGLLAVDQKQEWVTNSNGCEDCQALDGATTEMGGVFQSPKYGRVKAPPLHPHCECEIELAT